MARNKTTHYVRGCPWASGDIQCSDTDQTRDWDRVNCVKCLSRKNRTIAENNRKHQNVLISEDMAQRLGKRKWAPSESWSEPSIRCGDVIISQDPHNRDGEQYRFRARLVPTYVHGTSERMVLRKFKDYLKDLLLELESK